MFSWVSRIVPNLVPALGAFANPWVWVILLTALMGSFFYGVHMEAGRFEAFKVAVAAQRKAQEVRSAQRAKDNNAVQKEADDVYKTENGKLAARIAELDKRVRDTSDSYVPTRQQPVGSKCPDGQYCYDADGFDSAIRASIAGTQEFAVATAGIAKEGASLKLKLDTGIAWVAKQKELSHGSSK